MVAQHQPNEIHITRVYDATVKSVWDAWTDPQQVARWWGPRGFTLTTHSKDQRPGGIWHYTMYGPDGVDYPNKTLYHEVEDCSKLVYDHGGYDDRPPLFRVAVSFAETNGKTIMDMTAAFTTAEEAAAMRRVIKEAGGDATWDRLAEHLAEQESGRNCFVINRSFNAKLTTVFAMWTKAEHCVKWLPPVGFNMELLQVDIRKGGCAFFKMFNDADTTFFGRFEYQEIDAPRRLVYKQQFCDEHGNLSRHPGVPVWPATIMTAVLFAAEGPRSSRVSVTCEPFGNVSKDEMQAFIHARSGMSQGWTGSFDKLDGQLARSLEDCQSV
jgi:uncharacterized protein YndB with AHSA1/START domain